MVKLKETHTHKIFKNKLILYFSINIFLVFFFGILYWLLNVIFNYLFWKYPNFNKKYQKYFFEQKKNRYPDYKNIKHPSLNDIWHINELDYWIWFSLITQTTIGYGGIITRNGPIEYRNLSYPFKFFNIIQGFSVLALPIVVAFINHNLIL